MNTQQKIDCLNTIINERESIVWLKEIMQDHLVYLEEKGQREARLKDLDAQIAKKQQALALADEAVHRKEHENDVAIHALNEDYEKQKAKLVAAYLAEEQRLKANRAEAEATLATVEDNLAKAQQAVQDILKQQTKLEAAFAKSKRDYEAYKASLP